MRLWLACTLFFCVSAQASPDAQILAAAEGQQQPLLSTLEQLCNIEAGSRDMPGLARVAELAAARLRALGGAVEIIPAAAVADGAHGAMVKAVFTGKGDKSVLLIAHMDTVYKKGDLARQPFDVIGDRAYGLGVLDDRQGLAVILHAIALLKSVGFDGYGRITVLFNADEEIGSAGSRALITQLGSEADAVLSFEGSSSTNDQLALATSGIGAVRLSVQGRASHAGGAPSAGVNALVELAHQILQLNDLSDPARGIKLNWTLASAGTVRNMIPPTASAEADVRVLDVADYDALEQTLRERIKQQLLPGASVSLDFIRGRPPLKRTEASEKLAARAQSIYAEMGLDLSVEPQAGGGGTDAAYAGLKAHGPVIERVGLQGAGAHSQTAEYVLVSSIVPRLYLVARLMEDIAIGK